MKKIQKSQVMLASTYHNETTHGDRYHTRSSLVPNLGLPTSSWLRKL